MFGHTANNGSNDNPHNMGQSADAAAQIIEDPAARNVSAGGGTAQHSSPTVVEPTSPSPGTLGASVPTSNTSQASEPQGAPPLSLPATSEDRHDGPAVPAPGEEELYGIKHEALQHLSPLVEKLDQSPEEKFRTIMMMIQAADDHTLIKSAYQAAQAIPDDKLRAQALLDIVNEINYFTRKDQPTT